MNDFFNLHRFILLFKKTIFERPIQLLGLFILILLITLTIFSISVYFGQWNGAHTQAFTWGYVGGGIILASVIFGYFSTNASGAAYLILPASSFEKWFCGVLIAGVLFTCLFLGFFRLMDICFITAYHNGLDKNSAQYKKLYDMAQVCPFDGRVQQACFFLFSNFAGAAILGSLYFNKANLVKTALTLAGVIAILCCINLLIARMLFSNLDSANPFYGVFVKVGNDYRTVSSPDSIKRAADNLTKYVTPAILWLTAYIRLREKEI